jgi:hypothetical protein
MAHDTSAPFRLPLDQVAEDQTFNLRIFYGDLDELAVRLITEGQREPITVWDEGGTYYVVDGHRRRRAFARALHLRIVAEDGKHLVYEGDRPLCEAPGPAHPAYEPAMVLCRLADGEGGAADLFASRLAHHRGQPFTRLERSLFLSRLLRQRGAPAEPLALKIGFPPDQIAEARRLHSVDPRLLEQVRLGRLTQRLALRLLQAVPAIDQIARLKAARARAEADRRDQLLARDFDWRDDAEGAESAGGNAPGPASGPLDPVHARFSELIARLGEAARAAPNPTAEERLGTLLLIHRYAVGQIAYERLEAHLFGRR